jgi:hypothetical protein
MEDTHGSLIHKGLDDKRKHRGQVRQPNFSFVARDFESHANLHVAQCSPELVLFGILSKPPFAALG